MQEAIRREPILWLFRLAAKKNPSKVSDHAKCNLCDFLQEAQNKYKELK